MLRAMPLQTPSPALPILARLQPPAALPRLPVPTLRRGAQLLLDRSEAMIPFAEDLQELKKTVGDVIGRPRLEVLDFVGCPSRKVGAGPRDRWQHWTPPPAGTPVVVATDLGIGGPLVGWERAGVGEWCAFARRARSAGCPVIAFVPFAPQRWPREVARWITIVHWDRRTNAGAVRRIIGPRHPMP